MSGEENVRNVVPFESDDDVAAIARGLLDATLSKSRWTHAGHFAATVWLVSRRPDLDLPRTLPAIIRTYNVATGVANTDTGGYHETITQASIRAARAFLTDRPRAERPFRTVNALLAGPLGDPRWVATYWTHAVLFSTAARRAWHPPDVRPLPF